MRRLLRAAALAWVGILLLSFLCPTPAHADATVITVDTAEDDRGYGCVGGSACSLRSALRTANSTRGDVTIEFNIAGTAPHTIVLLERLPVIEKDNLRILGESDPDFVDRPVIVLDGSELASALGLEVRADGVTIRGLSFVGFGGDDGIVVLHGDRNTVRNCLVGISPSGEARGGDYGIRIWGEYNTIDSNVISGNQTGVGVDGPHNTLTGNYIGPDMSGSTAVPGMDTGIWLETGADDTRIGGAGRGEGNVISGGGRWGYGILVYSEFDNVIIGNKIGTNAAGDAAIPNNIGIEIPWIGCTGGCPAFNTRIESNVISGNTTCGIDLGRTTTAVYGNLIGTDASGTAAVPNGECGVKLTDDGVRLGGEGPSNTISGNPVGVDIVGSRNQLLGNRIGTNSAGTAAIPNGVGVRVSEPDNLIGGDEGGSGNLISGNEVGVLILDDHTTVRDNRIGTDPSGTRALPNGIGIRLEGYGEGDFIGGSSEPMANIIAFNRSHGVELVMAGGANLTGNQIHHNGGDGIRLSSGDVGAAASASRNTFSQNSTYGNGGLGIQFEDPSFNRGVAAPEITATDRTSVEGRACANCRVEVFLSDMDASGYGEGRTYLARGTANPDRSFRVSFSDVGVCQTLTATATDGDGNTSEFSRNAGVGICWRPPPLVALIWILIAGGGGSAFTLIIRRRPLHLRSLPWIVAGGLLGAAFGYLMLRLPFVQVDWGTPEAQTSPAPNTGHQQPPVTITPVVEIAVTPAPAPEVMAREDANCRQGPSTQFNIATHLLQGQVVPITGRLTEGGWWQVQPPDLQVPCWISGSVVEPNGDLSAVPLVIPPAPPTLPPTDEPISPAPGCLWWNGNVYICRAPCPTNYQGAPCTP